MANDFFMRMCREAQEELAKGRQGWKDVPTNTLILACFGSLYNHLSHRIVKPLWFFAGSVFAGVAWYIVRSLIG